jgi:cardiolipin synthase
MDNIEQRQQGLQILDSGEMFFADLLEQISCAQNYILIKQFLWRNDPTGRLVAAHLLEAMDRGVKVIILKDRIGAFHEYMESGGQSFFHDNPSDDSLLTTHSLSTVYAQANLVSQFYRNGVTPQQKNPLRDQIVDHPNATVVDQFKLYDHSKVVVIDGKTAYMGGIGFADEFFASEDRWSDYMVRINDATSVHDLLKVLAGEKTSGDENVSEKFHTGSNGDRIEKSLHDHILNLIRATRQELLIEMPFLGNPEYVDAIAECVNNGVDVRLLIPQSAPSHHTRNLHFVKTLRRKCKNPENLNVVLSPNVNHGKSVISDGKVAILGSHNLHMDGDVLDETVMETQDHALIDQMRNRFMQALDGGMAEKSSPPWKDIIIRSRLEFFCVKLQTLMSRIRAQEIERVRGICREEIAKLL